MVQERSTLSFELMGREYDYETSLMGVTTKDSVLLQAC